jgi:repressor LexA
MRNKDLLTKKQSQIYQLIKSRLWTTGKAPTLREIAQEIRVDSLRTVTQHLQALQKKGLIMRDRYARRGISLVEDTKLPGEEMIQVPIFASVGCGSPSVIAQRTYDEYIMVPPNMTGGNRDDLFVIRAIGTSMQDAGISDGDYVLVRQTEDVQNGDPIVAIVDGNAVIKRIIFANGAVILNPDTQDPQHHPIVLKSGDLSIFGKVMRVIKIPKSDDYQIVPLDQENNA